jgi:hypothetical protein
MPAPVPNGYGDMPGEYGDAPGVDGWVVEGEAAPVPPIAPEGFVIELEYVGVVPPVAG